MMKEVHATTCFKYCKAVSKALSSSSRTHRARSEVKEGRCSAKKRKMLSMCIPPPPPRPCQAAEKLPPVGLEILGLKKGILSGRKKQGISAPLQFCFSDHLTFGHQFSEEGEFISAKICFCLYVGALELMPFCEGISVCLLTKCWPRHDGCYIKFNIGTILFYVIKI